MARPKLTDEEKAARLEAAKAEAKAKRDAMIPFGESEAAAPFLNDEKLLTTWEFGDAFDDTLHKHPKRVDFAQEEFYLFYKAARWNADAATMAERAAEYQKQGEILASEPDLERRAALVKMAKAEAEMAKLRAILGLDDPS